jgi:hypothetical protein
MILVPLLIMLIFLLPYASSMVMSNWYVSTETLALQDVCSRVGSSIQQLYFFLNHASVPSTNVTSRMNIPMSIDNYLYNGNATLMSVVSGSSSSKVLQLTLFMGNSISVTSPISLGQNVQWVSSSSFMSNSTTACIQAYKDNNSIIWLSFGV